MRIVKNLVNKKQGMKKTVPAILIALMFLISPAAAQGGEDGVDIKHEYPEEGERVPKVDFPAALDITGEVYVNESAEFRSVLYSGTYNIKYNESSDEFVTGSGGTVDLLGDTEKWGDLDQVDQYEDYTISHENLSSGSYTFVVLITRDDRDPVLETVQFQIVDEVPDVEADDKIVDGGAIDTGIKTTANTLGVGLGTARMMISFFMSLIVGLAIGWTNSYKSTGIAYIGFLLTFISLILIGLTPTVEGIIVAILLIMGIWLYYKNNNRVVVND